MSMTDEELEKVIIEPEDEIKPESGHAKMPWFLLFVWIVNILFYLIYFIKYGVPNLKLWLNQ